MAVRINEDVLFSLCALAFIENLGRLMKENDIAQLGEYWKIAHRINLDHLFMAISRITDHDPNTVNVTSTLNYLEQNRQECVWLFSPDAKSRFPDGNAHIVGVLKQWREWVESESVLGTIRTIRDKYLAHKDKTVSLGSATLDPVTYADMRKITDKLGDFVNDIRLMTDSCHVYNKTVYDSVVRDLAHTLQMYASGLAQLRKRYE